MLGMTTMHRPDAERTADQRLWERLRGRDPEALGELFIRYGRDVHAFAVRRTGSYAAADDAVQLTFMKAWRHFVRGEPGPLTGPSARPWLLTIAHNELRNMARIRHRLRTFVSTQPVPRAQPDHADEVAARVDGEQRISRVHRALAKLPRHERVTVELVYWAGLSISETAEVLGVAEGTVKARLSRARRRLPDLLTPAEEQS
jgi:RNA polymerase sigma-70 factor, ECF subfamily